MHKVSASLNFRSQRDLSVLLEVAVNKEPIIFGHWTYAVRLGTQTLSPVGKWTSVCEHTEKGCEYIEIDLPLSFGYRLQRSLLIGYKSAIVLLCDTILADEDPPKTKKRLCYETEWNISPKLHAKIFEEASEIEYRPSFHKITPVFRAFPLALPEWKSAETTGLVSGTLTASEGVLKLRQETVGKSLCVPIFFDLNTERLGKKYTWRQLSIGENLKRVPEDQAAGMRIQLGQEQFLLYRSLTPEGNRTILGHNLIDDFCFARFNPETGVEPLIAVETVE